MRYTGKNLKEIIFPLGGIGTGSIGINGIGHLVDWEIFNRPDKGSYNGYTHIAVRADYPDGSSDTRVLQGDWTKDLMGKYSKGEYFGYGYGPETNTLAGFPHFKNVVFDSEFPFATLSFSDERFPATVVLTAFNPFIPQNVKDSALPAAIFDITLKNTRSEIKYFVCFTIQSPYVRSENRRLVSGDCSGVFLRDVGHDSGDVCYGDLTLTCDSAEATVQENWYRGGWVDSMYMFRRELDEGKISVRKYDEPGERDVSSVYCRFSEDYSRRFILTWSSPVCRNYWSAGNNKGTWKNRYAVLFRDSLDTNNYVRSELVRLRSESEKFRTALQSVSLGESVIGALSSALCVLKSPTVMLLEDGTFYGWEGLHEKSGSCEGTCTHVWSYAYLLCFLFPELERSIRDCELKYDVRENGSMNFRTKLPLGSDPGGFRPCADGQSATIFKFYREWMISGSDEWLRERWTEIKKLLSFFWSPENGDMWDADRDGILEGRQHHTLDMELFGPSSWLEGMYLAALLAASKMAEYLGDSIAGDYRRLYENGKKYLNRELFEGEYYYHKIDVRDRKYVDRFKCENYWNEEIGEMKYQIAEGSEIDQMLGQWHADILGLGDVFDRDKTASALDHMMRCNFKSSLRDVANTLRVFALNDESGTIICDYTDVYKPVIPIPYGEECMTGFEYAFAGLLLSRGMTDQSMRVVKAIRDRYDGEKRNPFNEIECGSNYARPMSCFALLPIASGFVFDMPHRAIGFKPVSKADITVIWGVSDTWGTYERHGDKDTVTVMGAPLEIERYETDDPEKVTAVMADGIKIGFNVKDEMLDFGRIRIFGSLEISKKHVSGQL